MICKRCLRPYVRPFKITTNFQFCEITLDWEGCADCAYEIKRQAVDFFIRASQPTHKAQSKQKYLQRVADFRQ